jgi:predicted RNA methylase
MPEPEQSLQPDWENEPTPERVNLKECADLMASILQTVALVEDPTQTISEYAEEFLRRHPTDLPQSAINEIAEKRQTLLDKVTRQKRLTQQ